MASQPQPRGLTNNRALAQTQLAQQKNTANNSSKTATNSNAQPNANTNGLPATNRNRPGQSNIGDGGESVRNRMDQARAAQPGSTTSEANRGLAAQSLQLAKQTATGSRNKQASLDRQLAGGAGALAGQALGAYLGGIGSPIGKRLGRIAGERYRLVLLLVAIGIIIAITQLLMLAVVIIGPVLRLVS